MAEPPRALLLMPDAHLDPDPASQLAEWQRKGRPITAGTLREFLLALDATPDHPREVVIAHAYRSLLGALTASAPAEELGAVVDAFVGFLPRVQDDNIARVTASALFFAAVNLQARGESRLALHVLERVLHDRIDSHDLFTRRVVAAALHHCARYGVARAEHGSELELAYMQYCLCIEMFFGEDDPALQEWVAASLMSRGDLIGVNGQCDEAAGDYDLAARAFVDAQDPFVRGLAGEAAMRSRVASSVRDLPKDVVERAVNSDRNHTARLAEARDAEAMLPLAEREAFRRRAAADAEQRRLRLQIPHSAALACLRDFRFGGQPFTLYLRNFTSEAVTLADPGHGVSFLSSRVFGGAELQTSAPTGTELWLRELHEAGRAVVTVSNRRDFWADAASLPRLILPAEFWRDHVERLIAAAAMIVVRGSLVTPGVIEELDLIKRQGRIMDTVVVLAREEHKRAALAVVAELYGHSFPPEAASLSHDDPLLAGFPTCVDEAADDWAAHPHVSQLVARMDDLRALGSDSERVARMAGLLDRRWQ